MHVSSGSETGPAYSRLQQSGIAAAWLLLLVMGYFIFSSGRSVDQNWQRVTQGLSEIEPTKTDAVVLSKEANTIRTTARAGSIEWREEQIEGVQYLQLLADSTSATQWQAFELHFIARDDGENEFDSSVVHHRVRHPRVGLNNNTVMLTWHLARPAQALKLVIPPGSVLIVKRISWAGQTHQQQASAFFWSLAKILCLSCTLAGFLTWLSFYVPTWHQMLASPKAISLLIVGLHGIMMIWFLPPFQGADENRHWKAALQHYRSDGKPGYLLHDLPDILEAEHPRWRSERGYPFDALHGPPARPLPWVDGTVVGYAGPWAYPIVGLVSLFLPGVGSVSEALIFYYICRLIPLALLCLMIGYSWRMWNGSWMLVIFLSFPLVMQQATVISTDTLPILGTLAGLLLHAGLLQTPGRIRLFLLWMVTLGVVLAKPPIYLVLLVLPLWHLPWRKVLRWQILLPTMIMVFGLAVAAYFMMWKIQDGTSLLQGQGARRQLEYVLTGEGFVQFFLAALYYPQSAFYLPNWWEPLGWLDTDLNDLHRALLWCSAILAVVLDLARSWPRLYRGLPECWPQLVKSLLVALLHAAFTWLSLALVMYLVISVPQGNSIVGMQLRYLFPVAIFVLVFPVIVVRDSRQPAYENISCNRQIPMWCLLGNAALLILSLLRMMQLAIDLQYRYGGSP